MRIITHTRAHTKEERGENMKRDGISVPSHFKNKFKIHLYVRNLKTLYFAAKTFFTITKLTSEDALVCKTPPIAVTNFPILTYNTFTIIRIESKKKAKELSSLQHARYLLIHVKTRREDFNPIHRKATSEPLFRKRPVFLCTWKHALWPCEI